MSSTRAERALTEFTESLAKLGALLESHTLRHMKVHAFVPIAAEAVLGKEPALGHLAQIVLVHELAARALLAQTTQPVLADGAAMRRGGHRRGREKVERRGGGMAQRTGGAERTLAGEDEGATEGGVRVELESEGLLDEGFLRGERRAQT